MKQIYVIGLGAMGGIVASKLYDLDPSLVKIIAGPERAARLREQPVIVNGKSYPFEYLSAPPGSVDLVIVGVKHHYLLPSLEDIRPFVGPDTVIMSLMNGISSEETLSEAFDRKHVIYAYGVGMSISRVGRVIEYSSIGRIVFGEARNETLSPRVQALKNIFDRAGIPCEVPVDMLRAQWFKFMMNVGINQVSMILRAPYGAFVGNQDAWNLLAAAAREVILISQLCGVNLDEADIDVVKGIIAGMAPDGTTSMLQDWEAGRKTEVEMFSGVVISLGKRYGIPTPVNQMLFAMIRYLESVH